jgi:diguanylate cyclase (GGDEF)-like protein
LSDLYELYFSPGGVVALSWLNNFKMRQKLIIAFLSVGFLVALVGIVGIRNMNEINSNQIAMYDMDLVGVKSISAVKSNLIQINFDMHKILDGVNESTRQVLIEEIEILKDEDDKLLKQYKKTIQNEKDKEMFKTFNEILKEYRTYRSEVLTAISNGKEEEAPAIYSKLDKVNSRIILYIDSYIQYKDQLAKKSYDRNRFLFRQTYVINGIIITIGLILAVVIAMRIASVISGQIEKVLSFAESLSKGNLHHTIEIDSTDEIGSLAKALNEAAATRMQFESELSSSYEELEASYEEITALEADLREKYQELESSFEEITALEEELREKYMELTESQENLEHIAYHDYLTDLPNRQYMYSNLNPSSDKAAVLFIDVDNFKYINDTMGHTFGDKLIRLVSERIKSILSSEDTAVRLGGDEFVIYLKDPESNVFVENFAIRLLQELNVPFEVLSNNVNITASVGIALSPQDGTIMDDLLKKADIAMYRSKYEGKNSYTFFENTMNADIVERMNIEKSLRKALDNEEFILHYQPQIGVESGKVLGFEALIRWISPELGFISPAKFIPIAEENLMIIDIGNWVLKTACRFIKKVHKAGRKECYISVNVSILQLIQSDFSDNVAMLLKELDLEPQLLELEITESVFIDSYEIIRVNIEKLKKLGARIALDDFGKGYSSLSYLKQLPIDTLKIDKSFIDDISSENDSSLVENIIMIGHKMGLEVVAEGVELENQASYLRDFKCDKIQGYFYSKPVPPEAALEMIIKS